MGKYPNERERAAVLTQAIYPELAEIVRQHHDLGPAPSSEAQLLYLADKLTAGTEPVTLRERFEAALEKMFRAEGPGGQIRMGGMSREADKNRPQRQHRHG